MSDTEMIEMAAIAAHEANRAYYLGFGDVTQKQWVDAPEWQKKSARLGAQLILDHPDTGPVTLHESWLAERKREGWKYGAVEDTGKKEHPCCVEFRYLLDIHRGRDFLAGVVIRSVLKAYAAGELSNYYNLEPSDA